MAGKLSAWLKYRETEIEDEKREKENANEWYDDHFPELLDWTVEGITKECLGKMKKILPGLVIGQQPKKLTVAVEPYSTNWAGSAPYYEEGNLEIILKDEDRIHVLKKFSAAILDDIMKNMRKEMPLRYRDAIGKGEMKMCSANELTDAIVGRMVVQLKSDDGLGIQEITANCFEMTIL